MVMIFALMVQPLVALNVPFIFTQSAGAVSAVLYSQGFESDTAGILDVSDGWYDASIQRVASGTNGINAASGSFYALADGESTGPFTRFQGYQNTWQGTWTARADVYLNPAWVGGEGFELSVATNGSDGNHQRDFIIHVSKDIDTGNLLVGASNNSGSTIPQNLESGEHAVISSAGWYTLEYVFSDVAGVLSVDMNVLDGSGTIVFTETRSTPEDTIPAEVGGNRYGWFTIVNVPGGLAIDNVELESTIPDIERPTVNFVNPSGEGQAFSGNAAIVFAGTDNDLLDTMTVNIKDENNSANLGSCGTVNSLNVPSHTLNCTIDTTNFLDGTYYLRAGATDLSGNSKTISRSVVFDNTKPSAAITLPGNGAVLPSAFTVKGIASDATSGIDHVLYTVTKITELGVDGTYVESVANGTANGTTNFDFGVSDLTTGFYRLKVQAFDGAGNWRYKHVDVEVDTTAPDVKITSPFDGSVLSGSVDIKGTVTDDNPHHYWLQVKKDGVALNIKDVTGTRSMPESFSNERLTTLTEDGAYEVTLAARDSAGGESNTGNRSGNVTVKFTIDTKSPTAAFSFSNSNGNALTKDDVTVTMTASEPIDAPKGWNVVDGSGNTQFTRVYGRNGKNELVITDDAGNDSASQKFEVKRIDRNAPTIDGVTNGAVVSSPVNLAVFDPKYQGFDGFERLQGLTVNGVAVPTIEGSSKTYLYTVSGIGSYTVVATDKAGNATTVNFAIEAHTTGSEQDTSGSEETSGQPLTAFDLPAITPAVIVPAQNQESQQAVPQILSESDKNEILGNQTRGESTTPLEDTGEVLGFMDSKLFNLAWYWYLVIIGALAGAWLALAAVIRRRHELE